MSVFAAVVAAGSFSAAARRLRMPLPTVSRKVAELEAHLRVRLLTRSTRQLVLTDAGADYLAACQRILEQVAAAERTAAGEHQAPRGELAVTAPIVLGRLHLLPLVAEFLARFPQINIELRLADRSLQLHDEHLDLAVRVGELPDSSLVAVRVGAVREVVCASPAYLAQHGTPRQPAELAHHDCISFGVLSSGSGWSFGSGRDRRNVAPRTRLAVNTAEAAIDAAIAGVGLTRVLSYQVAGAVQSGTLSLVLRKFEPAPIPVSLVHLRQPLEPAKLRAFLDFAAPRLKSRLLWPARN